MPVKLSVSLCNTPENRMELLLAWDWDEVEFLPGYVSPQIPNNAKKFQIKSV